MDNEIFPRGDKILNDNFTGEAYLYFLTKEESLNCPICNVTFAPTVRNRWHKHDGGQILIAISGTGYYQEKGNPIRILKPGDVVEILPDVIHWHGASPDGYFNHLAIETNPRKGKTVEWFEHVTDEEYYSLEGMKENE